MRRGENRRNCRDDLVISYPTVENRVVPQGRKREAIVGETRGGVRSRRKRRRQTDGAESELAQSSSERSGGDYSDTDKNSVDTLDGRTWEQKEHDKRGVGAIYIDRSNDKTGADTETDDREMETGGVGLSAGEEEGAGYRRG